MSINEFDCLTNAVLQAGLRNEVPVAFAVPARVRELVKDTDVRLVRAVTLHQCPNEASVDYRVDVIMRDGEVRSEELQVEGCGVPHETYVLYDWFRDGAMKHLHLVH